VRQLREAGVGTLLIAGSESDVRQVLPQLRYYGLEARVLGSGAWATPDALERIGLRDLEGAVVALPLRQDDPGGGWLRFRHAYEQQHRRSLENAIPALGYDAALLVLGALPAGAADAAATGRAVTRARRVQGATGELIVGGGAVARAPQLVEVREGRLVPVP
jgi:ABC-type branched-subunit amino acid transport system substrate-binding protein